MPFPGGWQGYSPAAYASGNDLGFDFFDFSPPRHPQMGTTPISEPPNSSQDPEVEFQDESRDIASEYQGGLGRYAPYDSRPEEDHDAAKKAILLAEASSTRDVDTSIERHQFSPQRTLSYSRGNTTPIASEISNLPQDGVIKLELNENSHGAMCDISNIATPASSKQSGMTPRVEGFPEQLMAMRNRPLSQQAAAENVADLEVPQFDTPPQIEKAIIEQLEDDQHSASQSHVSMGRDILTSADQVHYMQVFVEDVAVWMDSFNKDKYFARSIPYHALKSTMLLNALLACGARHASIATPENHEQALFYYNTATTQLLRSLQNPDRNTAECATTAIVLNVYEIMSEKPPQRMNHIAGSRALVRECGWDAESTGIGLACFWLNIGIEVLNCLATNWQTTWNPDEWGMNFATHNNGQDAEITDEQTWVYRALYIVAKVTNFRASATKSDDMNPSDEQSWIGNRLSQWYELKRLSDSWNARCPRIMQPIGYIKAARSAGMSMFPRIWMIQQEATIGQLLFHTGQCILSQTHPLETLRSSDNLRLMQLRHAYQVCGIAAHTTDRGVTTVAIRCLAIAAAVLTNELEQAEALDILERINKLNGWRLDVVAMGLKRIWGWDLMKLPMVSPKTENSHEAGTSTARRTSTASSTPTVMTSAGTKTPLNPLSFADFKLPNHPYQNWYEPPSRSSSFDPSSL
ncbi:Ff.00g105360.m01.CDS01 [Fusarium sp. VM40]|nr:Ff.00g105360.m01.CDS01 [Fusarium sp. VM40]